MVQPSAPRWKEVVAAPSAASKAAERRCWPWCCCRWSRRRAPSTRPSTSPSGTAAAGGAAEQVEHLAVHLLDVHHRDPGQDALVGRLAAPLRVKCSSVEHDRGSIG